MPTKSPHFPLIIRLIRHGETPGNTLKRYIGVTDEPLSDAGRKQLRSVRAAEADLWVISPMLRCRETYEIIRQKQLPHTLIPCDSITLLQDERSAHTADPTDVFILSDLRECDFGLFEGKNYQELSSLPAYQDWIDSGGTAAFPMGEDPAAFRARVSDAFTRVVCYALRHHLSSVNFVVHGGVIMSVMDAFLSPDEKNGRTYYDFWVPNGSVTSVGIRPGCAGATSTNTFACRLYEA